MAKAKKIDITDAAVAALPFEAHGERFYHDRSLRGFSVRVGGRTKTFTARADHYRNGTRAATRRIRLGAAGEISAELARAKAIEQMRRVRATGSVDQPGDPAKTTMGDIWPRYRAVMQKAGASERTIEDYADKIERHLKAWHDRPLASITRDEVHRRHAEISEAAGPFAANGAMRVARAMWNFASDNLELPGLPPKNPFRSTRRDSLYVKERARRNGMSTVELPAWAAQLHQLPTLRQALHLWCVLSGMRRRTVTSMRWADVDWKSQTLTVPSPKGGEPMALPLSRPMILLLRYVRRLAGGMYPEPARTWVWPSPDSATGHVEEIKERKLDKVGHALRSTFATISEEAGVTSIARKALLGHAVPRDVTERHYINRIALRPEFRRAQEKISALIVTTLINPRRAKNVIGVQ
jgi:integrase